MPDFKAEKGGKLGYWPDDWSVGNEIKLDRCIFKRENKEQNISIKTIVRADGEADARKLGREVCQ